MAKKNTVKEYSGFFKRVVAEYGQDCFRSLLNRAWITGEIETPFQYSHRVKGSCYFICTVKVLGEKGRANYIRVMTSEEMFEVIPRDEICKGNLVEVGGQIRNVNIKDGNFKISYVDVFIHPYFFKLCDTEDQFEIDKNTSIVYLKGNVSKIFPDRKMSNGETYVDMIISDMYKSYNLKVVFPKKMVEEVLLGDRLSIWGTIENRDKSIDNDPLIIYYNSHIKAIRCKIINH